MHVHIVRPHKPDEIHDDKPITGIGVPTNPGKWCRYPSPLCQSPVVVVVVIVAVVIVAVAVVAIVTVAIVDVVVVVLVAIVAVAVVVFVARWKFYTSSSNRRGLRVPLKDVCTRDYTCVTPTNK